MVIIRGARSLVHRAFKSGYHLPNTLEDAKKIVEKCEKYQFGPSINQPSNELKFIHNPIPFAKWGLNLLEPFPVAPRGVKFLIVGVDYFSKWIEIGAGKS